MDLSEIADAPVDTAPAIVESGVDELAGLFDTQCCIDCVRNARTVVSMACSVVSDLESGSILGLSSFQSIDGRVGGWLENVASTVLTNDGSALQDIDSASLIHQILSKFESLEKNLVENALDEAEAQCASLIDDIKSAYGLRYKQTALFQRAALEKSFIFRKKNEVDEADAWFAFSEKLSSQRLDRPNNRLEEAPAGRGLNTAEMKRAAKFLNAIRGGDWDQTRRMLQKSPDLANCWSQDGETPLHWAAWFQTPDIVDLLLKTSVDVNAHSKDKFPEGFTALHHAGTRNDEFIVELLVEARADISVVDVNGRTTLHYAALCGSNEAARSLVKHGVLVDAAEAMEGNTALHYAADSGNLVLVRFLLESGANVDATNVEGATSLIYAVKKRHFDTVRLLIDSGASLNIKDSKGKTAVEYDRNWAGIPRAQEVTIGRRKRKFES
ncbi:Ankyrin-1 [Drechslerella dactyloides]|uniref:Ankyrin-1 n=1 Tax=Drechslerella dactyloides TaxID=74499 RepID=A0AAD6J469_DREDA|nr:Ankyrin-1 [Drechslerella dactyloides]